MVVINILVFLISLSLVIVLHELGHFIFARRAGILCHEFSLGMGPVLWKTKKGETTYTIRAIPIGGYVMMAGEEIEDEVVKVGQQIRLQFDGNIVDKIILDTTDEAYEHLELIVVDTVDLKGRNMAPLYINDYKVKRDAFVVLKGRELQLAPEERNFSGKSKKDRFWAIFGGPMMNFLLAIVVFIIVNLIVGFPNMNSTEIGNVGSSFPAENILETGDVITEIEGISVDDWDALSDVLADNVSNRTIDVTVDRDGTLQTVTLTPYLFFYNIGVHSDDEVIEELVIGPVAEGTFAEQIGMQGGDTFVAINGIAVTTWEDVIRELETMANESYSDTNVYTFEMLRDGNIVTLTNEDAGASEYPQPYTAAFLESQGIDVVLMRLGIGPVYQFSFGGSLVGGFRDLGSSAMVIFTTLQLLFDNSDAGANVGVDDLAGPLGIYQITSQALSQGFVSLLSWIGLLSVNLGIVNLLPIPALDGGRLVFLGYEAVARKKPNTKVENTLHYVMYLALLGLFVFITFNDILRLFNLK